MATEDQPVCTGITFLSYVKSIVCPGAQTVAFEESTDRLSRRSQPGDQERISLRISACLKKRPQHWGWGNAGAVLYGRAASRHAFKLNSNFSLLSVRLPTLTLIPSHAATHNFQRIALSGFCGSATATKYFAAQRKPDFPQRSNSGRHVLLDEGQRDSLWAPPNG
jgi:hypothetical protein